MPVPQPSLQHYQYTSPDGMDLGVFNDPDGGFSRMILSHPGPASVSAEIYLPAEQVMPLCTALYRAVGDTEPQLHAAVSGAEVKRLSALIHSHLTTADYVLGDLGCMALARDILISGYERASED